MELLPRLHLHDVVMVPVEDHTGLLLLHVVVGVFTVVLCHEAICIHLAEGGREEEREMKGEREHRDFKLLTHLFIKVCYTLVLSNNNTSSVALWLECLP